jgi:hypothetical protein
MLNHIKKYLLSYLYQIKPNAMTAIKKKDQAVLFYHLIYRLICIFFFKCIDSFFMCYSPDELKKKKKKKKGAQGYQRDI